MHHNVTLGCQNGPPCFKPSVTATELHEWGGGPPHPSLCLDEIQNELSKRSYTINKMLSALALLIKYPCLREFAFRPQQNRRFFLFCILHCFSSLFLSDLAIRDAVRRSLGCLLRPWTTPTLSASRQIRRVDNKSIAAFRCAAIVNPLSLSDKYNGALMTGWVSGGVAVGSQPCPLPSRDHLMHLDPWRCALRLSNQFIPAQHLTGNDLVMHSHVMITFFCWWGMSSAESLIPASHLC